MSDQFRDQLNSTNALVLFSGGQDSATCLAWALERFARVEMLGFNYRQRHAIELECRARLLDGIKSLRPDWSAKLGESHTLDIPTLAEFVPGYEASQWYGVGAPKDTPAAVIDKLNKEINAVAADPIIKARLAGLGVDPMSMTSAEFGKSIAAETEKWAKVIRVANIKAE